MQLGAFVRRIHEERGASADSIRAELVDAARKAIASVLGPGPRIEVSWSGEQDTVEIRQVVTAVERVTQPYREVEVAKLAALGADFAGLAAGEELELSVFFHVEDASIARELDARFGGRIALSCFQRSLHAPLEDAWIEVVHRHLPPRTWSGASTAGLFQRGGWLTGTSASAEGVALSIAKTIWKERPVTPDEATIQVGFELRVERWGRALDLPRERAFALSEVTRWAATPAPESRRPLVEADLAAAALRLAGESSVDRLDATLVDRILASILGFAP